VLGQKVTSANARPDWMIAVELAERLGHDLGFTSLDDVTRELAVTVDAFAPATHAALAGSRDGVLLELTDALTLQPSGIEPPPGNAYEYRLVVSRKLYDAGQGVAHSRSLAHLAPGTRLHLHPLDADRLGATEGSRVKVTSTRTTLTLQVQPDAAIARGSAWVAFNQPDTSAAELIDADAWAIDVKVESL
jgi:predicted molibdopterin-dependent oxidoreductase YjgC